MRGRRVRARHRRRVTRARPRVRLAGSETRRSLRRRAARLDRGARLATALCVSDIATVNAAVADLQWTRNKAALALYHRTIATLARRAASMIMNGRLRTAPSMPGVPVASQRAELDQRAAARLTGCDEMQLLAIETAARDLRARWFAAGDAGWVNGRPRMAAELRTCAVYAYHAPGTAARCRPGNKGPIRCRNMTINRYRPLRMWSASYPRPGVTAGANSP